MLFFRPLKTLFCQPSPPLLLRSRIRSHFPFLYFHYNIITQ
ncbi:hypothetical protein HMPREF1548_05964 [Clostridium sp. KLE 1755]|nr:hypothetical protein HMPREF1548_05964 [Clostridium sp. KLE 1755]